MKKPTAILWICLSLLLIGAQATKSTEASAAASGVSKALIQQILDAWSTMDTNKITPFYSQSPENVFFDIAPMQYAGWPEWAKGAQSLFSHYQSFKLSLTGEPTIHNQGNWAWATYLWHVDAVRKDGKTETFDGRDTAIWQKVGSSWLTVHEHASVPVPEAATGKH